MNGKSIEIPVHIQFHRGCIKCIHYTEISYDYNIITLLIEDFLRLVVCKQIVILKIYTKYDSN